MDREEKEVILALVDDNVSVIVAVLELKNVVNIQLSLKSIEIPALLSHSPPLIAVAIFLEAEQCTAALALHKSNLALTDSIGRYPIHFASARGNLPILDILEQAGADLTVVDSKGRNILHYAAQFGRCPAMQWISAKHVRLEVADHRGFTPLHLAAELGDLYAVSYLLSIDDQQICSASGVCM
jgi:hypothetical protein